MSNLEELQGRILAAMERIGAGLDTLEKPAPEAAPAAPGESAEELKQALEDEKILTAQLEERIRVLHARQSELEADIAGSSAADVAAVTQAELAGALQAMSGMESEINRLRAANDALRENNAALREAHEASGAIVDAGLAAELEALRADHAAARAQSDAVLSALMPLVTEAGTAGGEES